MEINNAVNTNVFIILSKRKYKSHNKIEKISEHFKKCKIVPTGIEWSKALRESGIADDRDTIIYESAISHYTEEDNPYLDPLSFGKLTRRVNTIVLSCLTSKGCPLSRETIRRREGLLPFLSDLDKIKDMPLGEYKVKLLELIPEMVIIESQTPINILLTKGLTEHKRVIEFFELPSFKGKKFNFVDSLQALLTTNKDRLKGAGILTDKQIEEIKTIGYIEPPLAIQGSFNQAIDRTEYPTHPLSLFVHTIQHYYGHPDTDKEEFELSFREMIERNSKDILPYLTVTEIGYISDFFISIAKNLNR